MQHGLGRAWLTRPGCASIQLQGTFPWGKGLRAADQEKFWNETRFAEGSRFFD